MVFRRIKPLTDDLLASDDKAPLIERGLPTLMRSQRTRRFYLISAIADPRAREFNYCFIAPWLRASPVCAVEAFYRRRFLASAILRSPAGFGGGYGMAEANPQLRLPRRLRWHVGSGVRG